MREAILQRALDLGFDDAGIASVEPLPETDRYLSWLADGCHADMAWMARSEPRLDPEKLLPGVRSIVVLAMAYGEEDPHAGRVSRYARGLDYHRVMLDRAKVLGRFIAEKGGGRFRAFVDAAPLLEKYWAWRAGLGWPGKNTNLVSRRFGSWFFLGEVLTTLPLEPDVPEVRDACGTCRRCLDACPTGALSDSRRLDARRCLSYWTIEHRGDIPGDLASEMGSCYFGCDACLFACPWNRFFPRQAGGAFRRPGSLPRPAQVLSWSEEEYLKETEHSALQRAGLQGLRRNAALVLGNAGDPEGKGILSKYLDDADPVVRKACAWALARLSENADSGKSITRSTKAKKAQKREKN